MGNKAAVRQCSERHPKQPCHLGGKRPGPGRRGGLEGGSPPRLSQLSSEPEWLPSTWKGPCRTAVGLFLHRRPLPATRRGLGRAVRGGRVSTEDEREQRRKETPHKRLRNTSLHSELIQAVLDLWLVVGGVSKRHFAKADSLTAGFDFPFICSF